MANTFTLQSKNSYDGRYLKLTCTQVQNVSTNKSTIKWKLESLGGSVSYYYTGPTTVTINGTQVYYKARTSDAFPGIKGSASGELTVSHNTDGSKSISVSLSTAIYVKAVTSNSGTWTLDKIPRQASITVAPNFNDEQNPTITYSNPAGSAVDALDLCITLDGTTANSLAYRAVSKTGTSYTYTLSDTDRAFLRNATPDSNTRSVGFYLRTIIGGVEYYSKVWKTLTIVNADPVIAPTITDTNADTAALTGGDALIRYFSNAYFQTGARAQKGATLKSQSVTCGDVNLEGASGTFLGVQSGSFVFTATDSRGNTTTLPVQIPFVDYVVLSCSIGNNKPDTDGDFTLTASGLCYNGDIASSGSNDLYVLYRYKVSGGTWSDWADMAVSRDGNNYTAWTNFTGLDYRTTYIFQCKAGDLVTTATTDEVAIKSMPVFDWSGEDFNFNVPVSAPSLAVEDLTLGGVQLDYIVEQGTKSSWLYRKWNSGVMECWRRLQLTTNVSTAWGSLYSSGALSATNLTYPYAFVETPYLTVSLMPFGAGGLIMAPGNAYGSATQTGAFEITRGSSTTNASYLIAYHAIGRWK